MTREEFELFKEQLVERFYWCNTRNELNFLTKEKGNRFLFRCTHYKSGRYFWVFDRSESLMKDVEEYKSNQKEVNPIAD